MYGFITLEISSANDGYLSPTEKFLIGQCDRIFHTNIISYNQWPSHNSSFLAWCSENILETYPNTNTENCQNPFRRFIAWPSSVDGFSVFEFSRFFLSLFCFFSPFSLVSIVVVRLLFIIVCSLCHIVRMAAVDSLVAFFDCRLSLFVAGSNDCLVIQWCTLVKLLLVHVKCILSNQQWHKRRWLILLFVIDVYLSFPIGFDSIWV